MLITVLLAAELLFNPSLDKKNADGKGPEGWTLPKDCRVEYHEIAYLSDNMAVSFQRTSPGLLLEQKLSKKVPGKEGLTCVFDAVFPIEKYPLEWEVKDSVFRLFTKIPVTVQINSVSLKDEVSPLQLNLAPRLKPPKAEGEFPPRRLHVVAKKKSDIRVLMFFAGTDADWCAEDLKRQFGFKVDVVANGRTYDPETVQERFNRGEYVLLRCGGNPVELEKKPDSPIAEYIRRGGRAVYLSPRRGGTFGKPKALPKGMFPMCYPADHTNGTYIPNWTMWFMLELENYINRTGDTEIIPLAKKRVYALIGAFERFVNSDGLLENLESWVFVEWSKCNDRSHIQGVNYPSNMLFAAALAAVGRMFDDKKLIERAENMRAVIRKQAFNGKFFDDNAIRVDGELKLCNNITETCQYYAFAFDCASKEDYPELYNMMLEVFGPERDATKVYPEVCPSNALPGNTMRFDLLLREKKYERLIREIKTYYLPMARLTGTLWEHSGASCSLNHAFSSVCAMFISEALKGLNK